MVSPLREQLQELSLCRSFRRKSIVAVITQDEVIDDNLKKQIKHRTLFLLNRIFQHILAIGQKYLSIYLPSFFDKTSLSNCTFSNF